MTPDVQRVLRKFLCFVVVVVLFDVILEHLSSDPELPKPHQPDLDRNKTSAMECQHPKVFLLQNKLALVMGPAYCPIYDTIMAQYPHALEEPWSATMSEPYIHVGTHIVLPT